MKPNLPILIVTLLISSLIPASYSQTAYERELNQLIEQRDKAVAAAVAPINARFRASAEQLLRRATQGGDLDSANKIKAALETNTETPPEGIKDLRKQLVGTTWRSAPGMPVRPGLEAVLTFTDKTVEPVGLKYEVGRYNTVTITFPRGGTQIMTLAKGGTRLLFSLEAKEYAYELVPR